MFQTPPVEWIEDRLSGLKEVLERRTEKSAFLLRDVLGTIRLKPKKGDVGRPYYLAPNLLRLHRTTRNAARSGRPGRRFEFFARVEAAGVEPDAIPLPSRN